MPTNSWAVQFLVLWLCGAAALEQKLPPSAFAREINADFYCPKFFVPARPGGFLKQSGRQACCVADKAIGMMELLYAIHKCKSYQKDPHKPCYVNALTEVVEDITKCCTKKSGKGITHRCRAVLDRDEWSDWGAQASLHYGNCVMKCVPPAGDGQCENHPDCVAAHKYFTKGFQKAIFVAQQLYAINGNKDYTALSKKLIHLCDNLTNAKCYQKILTVLKQYGINYPW